ncbi:MAG TPA: ABC transporter substrate-binding protein [Ramlibacter sp.]|nr:ABC transporter substrate-binding protein [Ramlibacter sp.]
MRLVFPFCRALLALAAVAFATAAVGQAPKPAERIDRSANLRFVWVAGPAGFDPPLAKNQFQNTAYAWPVFDALVRLDVAGNVIPDLATAWSFSPDKKALTFTLRQGVRFTDGSDFNAAVAAKSLTRTLKSPTSLLSGQLRGVESFEAPDAKTLVVRLNVPDENILYTFATSAGMIVSGKALDAGVNLDLAPVGSGPYKLVSSGSQGATYERNEDYFDKSQNQFAKVVISPVVDATSRLNAILTGQADAGLFQADQQLLARTEPMVRSGKFTVHTFLGPNSLPLWLNTKVKPFDHPKVRQAMSLAIDRDAISQGIQSGACRPAAQPLQPGVVGHDEALRPPKRDVQRAKALLQEAGVSPFSFDALVGPQEPLASVAVALKAQFKDVGITMNIVTMPNPSVRPQFRSGSHPAMLYTLSVPAPDSASIVDAIYMSPDNPGGVSSEFGQAVAAARKAAIGSRDRETLFRAVSKLAYQESTHIFVCWSPNVIVARKGLIGVDKTPYLNALPIPDIRTYAATLDR